VRFLALSPAAAWLLLGAATLVILLLHLLKPPRRTITVASVMLWARTTREHKRRARRRVMALLLALGTGLSLALALTRPEIPAIAPPAQRITLILDNSASMAARTADGGSRWQRALEAASELLRRAGAGSEVLLLDTRGQAGFSGTHDRDAALAALGRIPGPGWGAPRIATAVARSGDTVHVITDGVAPLGLPGGAIVHSVYEPAENIGLTAFEARPLTQDPTRYEALVQMVNAASATRRVRLLIQGAASSSIAQDFDIGANETVNAVFDVSDFEGVLVASAISAGDAFPLDDVAYSVIPPHHIRRVLLVSPGNPALASALRNLPGVHLAVLKPADYSDQAGYDALVFDRFAPHDAPAVGALLIGAPARSWLPAGAKQRSAARIVSWDRQHAVSAAIDWSRVRLENAALEAPHPDAAALVLAGKGPADVLVTAGEARARWIKLAFSLQDSNFALQTDFPVFLGNALGWISDPAPALVRAVGSVIEVPLPNAQVRDGAGRPVLVTHAEDAVLFEALQPDVYTVSTGRSSVLVAANVSNARAALINGTRLQAEPGPLAADTSARWLRTELWVALLLGAYVLLLVDWAVSGRRANA
jgi:hypothetical protein